MNDTLYIELTSRCIIECPACPRTIFSTKFKRPFPKFDLDNQHLINFLNCEAGKEIKHFWIEGNHGDPIYYPALFEFIDHWRSTKTFTFITNGSNRSIEWWEEFASKLNKGDTIVFSIDGNETTNHLYRINSKWNTIVDAMTVISKSPAKLIWKSILFKTNQNQTDDLVNLAKDYGADEFILELTHRFGDNELYKPINFINQQENLTNKINAKCKDNKLLYISADSYVYPCCWVTSYNTLHKTEFWKNKSDWTILNTTLSEFIKSNKLESFVNKTENSYNTAYPTCQLNCNANNTKIKEYEQRIQY